MFIYVHNLPHTNSERRNSVFLCPQHVELKQWTHNPLIFGQEEVDKFFMTAGDQGWLLHCDCWLYIPLFLCWRREFSPSKLNVALSHCGQSEWFWGRVYHLQFCLDYLWRSEHVKPFTLSRVYQTEEFCVCFLFFLFFKSWPKTMCCKKTLYFCQWIGNGHSAFIWFLVSWLSWLVFFFFAM